MAPRTDNAVSALAVAEYFLFLAAEDFTAIAPITPMKLQKLAYYAQGYSLALHGRPLFHEPIRAWRYGPVVEPIYYAYQRYGRGAIPAPEGYDPPRLHHDTALLLNQVYGSYGPHDAWTLSVMTHTEQPWRDTPQRAVIPTELMQDFFGQQLRTAAAQRQEATAQLVTNEEEESAMDERGRLIQAAIATQALEGLTLPRDIAEEAFAAAQRRPLLDLR